MSAETGAAEARCAELHKLWQRADEQAAFHERRDHPDAPTYRARADAWKADYEAAVADLKRAIAAG